MSDHRPDDQNPSINYDMRESNIRNVVNRNERGIVEAWTDSGDNVAGDKHVHNYPVQTKEFKWHSPIPYKGSANFVGRDDKLKELHESLQTSNNVAISSVSGMGGIGKTELAVQYAIKHKKDGTYPGGIFWFNMRESSLTAEVLQFAQLRMDLEVPQELSLKEQAQWCWEQWKTKGDVLVVLDDVAELSDISDALPQIDRFRVLITARVRNLGGINEIDLEVLSPPDALRLLKQIAGDRVEQDVGNHRE
jgi:hypothetical protein